VNLSDYISSMSKQIEPRKSGQSKEKSAKIGMSIVEECIKHNKICGVSGSIYYKSVKKREKIPVWNMLEVKGTSMLQEIVLGCTSLMII